MRNLIDNKNTTFLALLKAGLWEQDVRLSANEVINYQEIFRTAEEQAVVGIVTVGLEHAEDIKLPKEYALQFAGQVLQLEQSNIAMNNFIGVLVNKMHEAGLSPVLIKGQGVGQCYIKPERRSCGDVDLVVATNEYEKGKVFLRQLSLAENIVENTIIKEFCVAIDTWMVELHGTLNSNLSKRIDSVVKGIINNMVHNDEVRLWNNGATVVHLPSPDNDVVIVFTHILQHLYCGGIGLRQICDWTRLIWTYYKELDLYLLEHRLKEMGVMKEWKAFGSLVVEYLGLPKDKMPFYSDAYGKKAGRLMDQILYSGNFGRNRDRSYQERHSGLMRKLLTMWYQVEDSARLAVIFPKNAIKFLMSFFIYRVSKTVKEMNR